MGIIIMNFRIWTRSLTAKQNVGKADWYSRSKPFFPQLYRSLYTLTFVCIFVPDFQMDGLPTPDRARAISRSIRRSLLGTIISTNDKLP